MVELTYQMILSTIQTVSLMVGIVYYITIMRNQQRTRLVALKVQEEAEKTRKREMIILRSQTYTMEYADAYLAVDSMEDWTSLAESTKLRYEDPKFFAQLIYIRNLFNSAGLLLKEQDVDPELLFQLYAPGAVISLWEKQLPHIIAVRKLFNYPGLYSGFEYLYNQAKRIYPEITYPK